MTWAVTADPSRFDEASDWFLKRIVIDADEAERIGNDAGRRAFWVGGGLQLTQVQRVFDKIQTALDNGEPFDEWRKRVRSELTNDAHAETVFRNAVQRSYNAGRYRQMRAVQSWRPYWMFDSILDDRTTKVCKRCNKTILRADNPWWLGKVPPLHHRCRSSLRSLSEADARKRGILPFPPLVQANDGFGAAPEDDPIWKPEPLKHDPALLDELESKQTKPKRKPRPKKSAGAPPEHDPKYWAERYRNGESGLASDYGDSAPAVAWGRAMLERGMDRPAAEVLAELQRLQRDGHPALESVSLDGLAKLGTKSLRKEVVAQQPAWRALIALQEHTRTIDRGEFELPINEDGPFHPPAILAAKAWFERMLDTSVVRPTGRSIDSIAVEDGRRPFFASRSKRIVLGDGSEKGVAQGVHEFAHAIEESDPRALSRSLAFLKARTKGNQLKKLSVLTGISHYGPDELAREDKFFDPYVGKDYAGTATEVTSMGYERLTWSGPWELQRLMKTDPDLLFFLLGQLAGR